MKGIDNTVQTYSGKVCLWSESLFLFWSSCPRMKPKTKKLPANRVQRFQFVAIKCDQMTKSELVNNFSRPLLLYEYSSTSTTSTLSLESGVLAFSTVILQYVSTSIRLCPEWRIKLLVLEYCNLQYIYKSMVYAVQVHIYCMTYNATTTSSLLGARSSGLSAWRSVLTVKEKRNMSWTNWS